MEKEMVSPFLVLGKNQAELFMQDNISYMNVLVNGDCNRSILHTCYNILVRQEKITPIEKLSEPERRNIWETAKEFAKETLSQEKLIELSKALLSLEYFLQ